MMPRVAVYSTILAFILCGGPRYGSAPATALRFDADAAWFMLVGQSNMVGASTQTTPTGVTGLVYRRVDPTAWYAGIEDPEVFGFSGNRQSAWPTFANERPGRELLFGGAAPGSCLMDWVGTGAGNESRDDDWNPDGDGSNVYNDTLNEWTSIGSPELTAILWNQGECDAAGCENDSSCTSTTLYNDYYTAFLALLDAFLEDYGPVPVIISPVTLRYCENGEGTACGSTDPYQPHVPVYNAQVDACNARSWCTVGPDANDLELMPDGIHILDVVTYGERWAASVAAEGL